MRKLAVAMLAAVLGLGAVVGLADDELIRASYEIAWTAPDGTVIGGLTRSGRVDTLLGARFHGDVLIGPVGDPKITLTRTTGDLTLAGDLEVLGTITVHAGTEFPEPWTLREPLTLGEQDQGDGSLIVVDEAAGDTYATISGEDGSAMFAGTVTIGDDTVSSDGVLSIVNDAGVEQMSFSGASGNAMIAATLVLGDNTADTHGYLQLNNDAGLAFVEIYGETGNAMFAANVSIGSDLRDTHGFLEVVDDGGVATFEVDGETGDVTAAGDLEVGGNVSHTGATNAGALMVTQFAFDYEDTGADIEIGVLPANAYVLSIDVVTTTAFTGGNGATAQVDIGWDPTRAGYANDLDIESAGIADGNVFENLGHIGAAERTLLMDLTTDRDAGEATIRVYWTLGEPGDTD